MERKTLFCIALLIGIVLSAGPVLSCEKTLFGPRTFTVGRFHFVSSFGSFQVEKPMDAILEISSANSHGKVYNGYLNLNGRFFSLHPLLHTKDYTMQVPVQLRSRNYLFVFLYGQRGAGIKLELKEEKQEPVNHEPVALDQAVELDEDSTASIALTGSDEEGDPLTFRIVSAPAHGTLSGDAPVFTYAPSANYNGSDSFTFIVNDGKVDSKPATVNITIKPVNDPPTAVAIAPAIAQVGEQVTLDGKKSTDVDGDKLTYLWTWVSPPMELETALSNATAPLASFVPFVPGQYKVRLVVNDGTTDSAPETVTISVAYPPVALTQVKLLASDGGTGDRFGTSLSVDNDHAIIGAEGKEAAYIFESSSPWTEKARLASGKAGDGFGSAVAVSGDYALVGAQGDDELGVDSGSAYLFWWNGAQWIHAGKLTAHDGKAGDFFGGALSLSGDYAVVGAHGDDTGGEEWVPIFGRDKYVPGTNVAWDSNISGWVNPVNNRIFLYPEVWARNFRPKAIRMSHTAPSTINLLRVLGVNNQILCNATSYTSGTEVSLITTSDIALISALSPPAVTNIEFLVNSPGGGPDAGSAYVFKRAGEAWIQETHLRASDGAAGDGFGISVAISDENILVGAHRDDDKGLDSGSAYVFVQAGSGWSEDAKLVAQDGQAGDQFGASVAISGKIAVVGAPGADSAGADSGAAYLFRYNGLNWSQEAKLLAVEGKAGDRFGASVSISNDYVVVGAPGSGAMYVFKYDGSGWNTEGKVVPTDNADGKEFGGSVAISGDVILSGARGDSEKADQAGAAYAYLIDTYHTASIDASPEVIKKGNSSTLSWSWVNALVVHIDPDVGASTLTDTPTGSGSATLSPDVTTTYTITAYGPYGKDMASVTVVVEP